MKNIDFGQIIKRSWSLAWNNKWLWVMGLVLVVFGAGGSSASGLANRSNTKGISTATPSANTIKIPTGPVIYDQSKSVLGDATSVLKDWFIAIPLGTKIFVGVLILVLIIIGAIITLVLTSWAQASLIAGLNDADMGGKVTLISASKAGTKKIKEIIIFRILAMLLVFAAVFVPLLLVGAGFLIKILVPVLGTIWIILFGILGSLAFIVALFLFSMATVYAERLIVLKDYSPWNAWKKGFGLGKGNFLPTLLMGIIDSMISGVSGCLGIIALLIVFALPGFLLIAPIFKGGFHFPSGGTVVGIVILLTLFFSINSLLRAVYVVFSYGNWNLIFKQILANIENEQ